MRSNPRQSGGGMNDDDQTPTTGDLADIRRQAAAMLQEATTLEDFGTVGPEDASDLVAIRCEVGTQLNLLRTQSRQAGLSASTRSLFEAMQRDLALVVAVLARLRRRCEGAENV